MFEKLLKGVCDEDEQKREKAWEAVTALLVSGRVFVDLNLYDQFVSAMRQEADDKVRRIALDCILQMVPRVWPQYTGRVPFRNPDRSLDDWLFALFDAPSVLMGVSDNKFNRRDELPLAHIARCFPKTSYPATDLQLVPIDGERWDELVKQHGYMTVLMVGRLSLYGDKAKQHLQLEKPVFAFPDIERPHNGSRSIVPEYHRLLEHQAGARGSRKPEVIVHQSRDDENDRVDYALLQVYSVEYEGKMITIVQLAGCSSLGTLGAAIWFSDDLSSPFNARTGAKIPVPPNIDKDCPLEILLEVKGNPLAIDLPKTHLKKVVSGNYVWSPNAGWKSSAPVLIELFQKDGKTKHINVNGVRMGFYRTRNIKLFTRLCYILESLHQRESTSISISELADTESLWDSEKTLRARKAALQRIISQKDELKNVLIIDDDELSINGTISIVPM